MSGPCFVTAVTAADTLALPSTYKTNTFSDPNEDAISRICLSIANVKLVSACLYRRVFFCLA